MTGTMPNIIATFIDPLTRRTKTLIRAWDMHGDMHYISEEHYRSGRTQIPLRFSTGLPLSLGPVKEKAAVTTIHRANIVLVRHLDGSYVAGSDDQPAPEEAAP